MMIKLKILKLKLLHRLFKEREEKIRLGDDEVLCLKVLTADRRSGYNIANNYFKRAKYFKYPRLGGIVTAPDWESSPSCGHGLHGFLWAKGEFFAAMDHQLLSEPIHIFQVHLIKKSEMVNLGGKVKYKSARVVFESTNPCYATDFIKTHMPDYVDRSGMMFNKIVGGDGVTQTQGISATMRAGDDAHQVAVLGHIQQYAKANAKQRAGNFLSVKQVAGCGATQVARGGGAEQYSSDNSSQLAFNGATQITGDGSTQSSHSDSLQVAGDRANQQTMRSSIQIAGENSTQDFQGSCLVIAGDYASQRSQAEWLLNSIIIAGDESRQVFLGSDAYLISGEKSRVTCGAGCKVLSGLGSVIKIKDLNSGKFIEGTIGEDGLLPGVWYEVKGGNFIQCNNVKVDIKKFIGWKKELNLDPYMTLQASRSFKHLL